MLILFLVLGKTDMTITIYRANALLFLKKKELPQLLGLLPTTMHERALRYRKDQAAYNYVIGRLLLKQGLSDFDLSSDLEEIEYQETGKPFLPAVNFNISHSADQVICGFSEDGALGIDIEKIQPISFDDFTSMFTPKEWFSIKGAVDPMRSFYWYWTRKESIIKALGLKLDYLHRIELDASLDHFEIDGRRWFLRDLVVADGYLGAVCSECAVGRIDYLEVWEFL